MAAEADDPVVTSMLRKTAGAGIDPRDGEPMDVWTRLWSAIGKRATLLDLYALVALRSGCRPRALRLDQRRALAVRCWEVTFPGFEMTGTEPASAQPIELDPYDPAWPERFATWRRRLVDALGATAVSVDHVGSTSVPGLPAKPVVDIQVSVADLADEGAYVALIESTGVELRSRDDEHRFFRPPPDRPRDAHVHVVPVGSVWEREHLLFRDYLRAHADAREAYARAKAEAARMWRDDRAAYTEAKSDVILDILDRAEQWAAATGWSVR